MTRKEKGKDERKFTIELRSKAEVNTVSVDGDNKVLIEGSIGSLKRARFLEGLVLEVIGTNGELRLDLSFSDLSPPAEGSKEDEEGGK